MMHTSPIQPGRRALLTGKLPAMTSQPGLVLPPATSAVTPFRVAVPQALLDDLQQRLALTRWPDRETGPGWSQGVPLQRMQDVVRYWQRTYDWRRAEAKLNAFPQFRTEIDGLGIHFLHVRSKHEHALPLILTHGWPGSVFEFLKTIGPLVDPTAHGGKAEHAFHVVVPSLPGFGFSDRPRNKGWNVVRIAKAWGTLMARLGYTRWVAQGGDWGAGVTTALGHVKPQGLAGIHLNWQFVFPEKMPTTLSSEEQRAVDGVSHFLGSEYGYFNTQSTVPQTVGEVLSSTPAGQAAWIYEKFQAWSDNGGDVERVLTRDELLDDISLYWLTNTSASSARIYWENSPSSFSGGRLDLPVAVTVFPKEIYRAPRSWGEATYPQLIYWNEVDRGGHFAAFEQPALFAAELRAAFATFR
jgi:pimeloyl-ACP methyl ester carboxylesterase